ncbi:hypothetical protein DICA1_E14642 [Diutina catenulata]
MPRQRSSRPAPSSRTQTRSAHTATAPPTHAAAPPHYPAAHPVQTSAPGGGFLSQVASTATGVAIGSTVSHGISSLFSGSSAPAVPADAQVAAAAPVTQQTTEAARHCDADARMFTKCLEDNNGNMQICDYYLQQLKACQETAKYYTA